jgi:GTP cyclohydrolase I
MPIAKRREDLPDIQESLEGFPQKAIKKVGIRKVRLPIGVMRKDGSVNQTTAEISIYTDLNDKVKGANMSRYRIVLEELAANKDLLMHEFVRTLMDETKLRLGTSNAYVKIKFDYFLVKEAPVSKTPSHMNYECTIEGVLNCDSPSSEPVKPRLYLTVQVPYTSLCPCSKKIARYGAHNQRSFADVKVELIEGKDCWIEEIVDLVESVASSPIRNTLKRADESWQTELMYEQPMFVEDMIRAIAVKLDEKIDNNISDYSAVVNHEESIHLHNAVAVIAAGRELT